MNVIKLSNKKKINGTIIKIKCKENNTLTLIWSGGVAQKNGKNKTIWPEWSNISLGGTSSLECPRHLSKVQCAMHFVQSSMLLASW